MLEILELEKPLIFFDLETTGLNKHSDKIVEFSALKLYPELSEISITFSINPEMHIPAEVTKIHMIGDADVENSLTFPQCGEYIKWFFEDGDIAGYNIISFDLSFILSEFHRANIEFSLDNRSIVDVFALFLKLGLGYKKLGVAYQEYCGKTLENAHSAEADVRATAEVLEQQLIKYSSLPTNVKGLYNVCKGENTNFNNICVDNYGKLVWQKGEAVLTFGKYKGMTLKYIYTKDIGYLKWLAIKSDFGKDIAGILKNAIKGVFPTKNVA